MAKPPKQHIFMPNEIFGDLRNNIEKIQHVAFAYSYYYYVSYLYRYCEYEGVTQSQIKANLGYATTEKRLDYIIKQNGILDVMGYTSTTKDYPISWNINEDGVIEFITINDHKKVYGSEYIISEKNSKVKLPVKMFHRTEESLSEGFLNGTLYDVSNTHKVLYAKFEKCMNNDQLGVTAFYIYSYLRSKNDMYGDYRISSRTLAEDMGLSRATLFKYLDEMESAKNRLVTVDHKKFIGVGGEANLYKALT